MKKGKRYIKKQNNKPLINKKVLAKVIRESNICKTTMKNILNDGRDISIAKLVENTSLIIK